MKEKDITKLRFGKLIALYPTERKINGTSYWMCRCDCGNQLEVLKSALTHKVRPTKSCGCLRVNAWNKSRKHYGCMLCGSDKHYAKGYCKNCYEKERKRKK